MNEPVDACNDGDCASGTMCFKHKVRTLRYSATATPNARASNVPPRTPDPAWERGLAGERRPDGSFCPYLTPGTKTPMRVKEFSENRHLVESSVRALKQTPSQP